jgi:hypothetical protein
MVDAPENRAFEIVGNDIVRAPQPEQEGFEAVNDDQPNLREQAIKNLRCASRTQFVFGSLSLLSLALVSFSAAHHIDSIINNDYTDDIDKESTPYRLASNAGLAILDIVAAYYVLKPVYTYQTNPEVAEQRINTEVSRLERRESILSERGLSSLMGVTPENSDNFCCNSFRLHVLGGSLDAAPAEAQDGIEMT